jgi:hypothetical protein
MSDEIKNNHNCEDEGCSCGHDHAEHDGCDCGCEEVPMVYLEREDGTEVGLPIVASFEYKDVEYVVVDDEDEEASYIFSIAEENGEEVLVPVSDEMFDEVSAVYDKLMEEEFDDEDEE